MCIRDSYITLAFALGTKASIAAGFIHMFNHALIKGALFMAITSISFYIQKRVTLNNLSGLGKAMPITFFCFLVYKAVFSLSSMVK